LTAIVLQLRQGEQSVRQAQSGFYPQVNVQSSYIFTSDRPELGDSSAGDASSWQVVGQVDWTFWDWGRTRNQVSARRANLRKLEASRRDLLDGVDLQVKQALLTLSEAEKNIATAQASITSAEENFRITRERFREQLATNTEVLEAQTQLTQARNNLYSALTVFNLSEASLQRAMGRGLSATKAATPPDPSASGGPRPADGPDHK
jgi:outer membrane protein